MKQNWIHSSFRNKHEGITSYFHPFNHSATPPTPTPNPTHSYLCAPVAVGGHHAEEDEDHEGTLAGHHHGPQHPVLLHPAGAPVQAGTAARPAGQADREGRVAGPGGPVPLPCLIDTP